MAIDVSARSLSLSHRLYVVYHTRPVHVYAYTFTEIMSLGIRKTSVYSTDKTSDKTSDVVVIQKGLQMSEEEDRGADEKKCKCTGFQGNQTAIGFTLVG